MIFRDENEIRGEQGRDSAIVSRYHPVCKGNALNLNADDNISGESLDDTNEKPSTRNLWGSEINY